MSQISQNAVLALLMQGQRLHKVIDNWEKGFEKKCETTLKSLYSDDCVLFTPFEGVVTGSHVVGNHLASKNDSLEIDPNSIEFNTDENLIEVEGNLKNNRGKMIRVLMAFKLNHKHEIEEQTIAPVNINLWNVASKVNFGTLLTCPTTKRVLERLGKIENQNLNYGFNS